MKSLSTLLNLGTSLTQNITGANQSLLLQLYGDQQRYLVQDYFDNEKSFSMKTLGGTSLTLSASPVVGDSSATLATAWVFPSCTQFVNFADGEQREVAFTNGSTAIAWAPSLNGQSYQLTGSLAAGATTATLATAWSATTQTITATFSDGTSKSVTFTQNSTAISWAGGLSNAVSSFVNAYAQSTSISNLGLQYYPIPANVSKITDNTISVGQLKFTIIPVQSRPDWDKINYVPYTADIPQYAFIYNGTLGIFPIPATTGNLIGFNYKTRIPDFSTAFLFSDTNGTAYVAGQTVFDYQKGTASGTAGGYTITGASTPNWTTAFPTGDVTKYNLYFTAFPIKGDGLWYPISTIDSATSLTLSLPLVSTIAAGATYAIAQMPVLQEDFHDMITDGALIRYFSDIVKNPTAMASHQSSFDARKLRLENYAGTKQINVDLGAQPNPLNPNIFLFAGPNQSS